MRWRGGGGDGVYHENNGLNSNGKNEVCKNGRLINSLPATGEKNCQRLSIDGVVGGSATMPRCPLRQPTAKHLNKKNEIKKKGLFTGGVTVWHPTQHSEAVLFR